MAKKIILTLLGLLLLAGILGGIKALQIRDMVEQGSHFAPPPEAVTTARVEAQSWEALLTSVGSLQAVQGVTVAAELPGKVATIAFEPGSRAEAGDLLVQQDTSAEEAQLAGAEAEVALAKSNLDRATTLLGQDYISQAEHDSAVATYKQASSQVDNIRAAIRKKTIRAPFAGRLGIRLVNLGQILNAGDAIVSLQALDPIFVNFLLPQQELSRVRLGLVVRVTADALPGREIQGKITAINPEVDAATRNVRIQATVPNPREELHPGMFVKVAVALPKREEVLVIPATAVLYAPYGDSVFMVEEHKEGGAAGSAKVLRQQFVRLGEKRGDFVAVASGVKAGEIVVSTGVFKLRNGQTVAVHNALAPQFKLSPKPKED